MGPRRLARLPLRPRHGPGADVPRSAGRLPRDDRDQPDDAADRARRAAAKGRRSTRSGWPQRGEGLHHLGFWVDSLTEAAAEFTASGYEAIQTGAGYGLDGDGGYAYFDTSAELGVILELIEVPKRRREPDFVYPA